MGRLSSFHRLRQGSPAARTALYTAMMEDFVRPVVTLHCYNRVMHIPERIPGRRLLAILLIGYAAIWIVIEGNPTSVWLLAILVMLYLSASLLQRFVAGRVLSLVAWLMLCAGAGLVFGLGSAVLTLFLMALKSGIHAHGPEFTPEQIGLVISRAPSWTIGGLLVGLGVGLLVAGLGRFRDTTDDNGPV